MTQPLLTQSLQAEWITPVNFKPYGQVISACEDGKLFDETDAQLDLHHGTPRFYIMGLPNRGCTFSRITRHHHCTQCLGSLAGKDWLMVVAPPGDSKQPAIKDLKAFQIPGTCFIKLEKGTWHAGPYFVHEQVDFYNLELSNTNEVDHLTHDFAESHGLEFEIINH